MTEKQETIDGTDERPPVAGVRWSLSEAKCRLKPFKTLGTLQDDKTKYTKIRLPIDVHLTSDEAKQLPEIGATVAGLMELGTTIPSADKNVFKLGIGRVFAGAKYRISGKPGRIEFNGDMYLTPSVVVTKGKPTLTFCLTVVVPTPQIQKLETYLSQPGKLTVEPPQQELYFAEAS